MCNHLPTVSLFAVIALVIGASQGTYIQPAPVKQCCENADLINGECVCKTGYKGESTHPCVPECYGKCNKATEKCDRPTFKCLCKAGFKRINGKCQIPCGGACVANAECNEKTNECECKPLFIGKGSVRCYRPSTFKIRRPQYSIDESGGVVRIQVDRFTGLLGANDVTWVATDLTANFGKDYKGKTTSVVKFASLQTSADIVIPIVDDEIDEPDETFEVKLTAVNNNGKIVSFIKTVVTIHDNDLPCRGACKRNEHCDIPSQKCLCNKGFVRWNGNCEKPCFDKCCANAYCDVKKFKCICNDGLYGNGFVSCQKPSEFKLAETVRTVPETAGTIEIKVLRMVSTFGPAKVTWKATDGTANHGLDYVGHAGQVFFLNGQSEGVIKIKIVDDQISESPETFKVILTDASNPATVVDPKTMVITIKDDDKPCHGHCGTNAVCNEDKHICVCEKGFLGDPYKECHRPCYGKCLSNAVCNINLNACVCNKGLVGDGVNKCAPPCDGKCKDYKYSHCNFKTNKCECNPNYYGDPYTSGCRCSTSHY